MMLEKILKLLRYVRKSIPAGFNLIVRTAKRMKKRFDDLEEYCDLRSYASPKYTLLAVVLIFIANGFLYIRDEIRR